MAPKNPPGTAAHCRLCDGSRRVWLPNPDDLDLMVPAAQAHPLADNVLPCPACGPNVAVAEVREVVHLCPHGDQAVTPCCARMVLELPRFHRLTVDPKLVTCGS